MILLDLLPKSITLPRMRDAWHTQFEDILIKQFEASKKRNKRVSLRTFAKAADISPTSMSFILNRSPKWSLTLDRAIECLENLKVAATKIDHFKVNASKKLSDRSLSMPDDNQSLFLTDADYIPVLLSHGLNTPPSMATIAKKLGRTVPEITKIRDHLVTMGHLQPSSQGFIIPPTPGQLKTKDGPSSEEIRKHHAANIDVVKEALLNGPTESRDITSFTLTGDINQMAEVKNEIRQFYQRIHAIMNHAENRNEIFKVVVGFVPLNFIDNEKAPSQ